MKHYIFIILLLIYKSVDAQTIKPIETDSLFSTKLTGETYLEYRGYNGNQYYYTDWVDSDILLSTGEKVFNKKLKYNGLLDEVIWLNTSIPGLFQLDKEFICDFWLKRSTDKPNHFKLMNVNDTIKNHKSDIFAEVIVEGKVSLYIHRQISVVDVQSIMRDNKLYPYKTIAPTPIYYIKLPTNKFTKLIKLSRISILKVFPDQKKKIRKLIRENHLDMRTENGLKEMIELMNDGIGD
jgi:hypothetical protein